MRLRPLFARHLADGRLTPTAKQPAGLPPPHLTAHLPSLSSLNVYCTGRSERWIHHSDLPLTLFIIEKGLLPKNSC